MPRLTRGPLHGPEDFEGMEGHLMTESSSVLLGRADIEEKMFECMREGRVLPCRRREMVKWDGGKRGGQGGARAGEAGWQSTHGDFVIKAPSNLKCLAPQ